MALYFSYCCMHAHVNEQSNRISHVDFWTACTAYTSPRAGTSRRAGKLLDKVHIFTPFLLFLFSPAILTRKVQGSGEPRRPRHHSLPLQLQRGCCSRLHEAHDSERPPPRAALARSRSTLRASSGEDSGQRALLSRLVRSAARAGPSSAKRNPAEGSQT